LAIVVNFFASALATTTALSYLLIYTPLKRTSSICTLVGALPGAAPPLIGWAGASGSLASGAWVLYGILFLWQLPHFMAIAWIPRRLGQSRLLRIALDENTRCFCQLHDLGASDCSITPDNDAITIWRRQYLVQAPIPVAGLIFLFCGCRFSFHKSSQT
jgi:hypothetical protein